MYISEYGERDKNGMMLSVAGFVAVLTSWNACISGFRCWFESNRGSHKNAVELGFYGVLLFYGV